MNQPRISVVIVNYNVKEYLAQALHSLQRALKDIPHEIFVVDNASVDGSVAYIRQHFPDVRLIESKENLGFAKANNLALQHVQGEYVVLINPDTVVQEDTFQKLLDFFEKTPDASAATCKIINPDGTFSVDCRHAIPTPMIAFWKVTGLSRLFPRSRIFGQYNLTYLDPNETYPVPAISGSFMMIKKPCWTAWAILTNDSLCTVRTLTCAIALIWKVLKFTMCPLPRLFTTKGKAPKRTIWIM